MDLIATALVILYGIACGISVTDSVKGILILTIGSLIPMFYFLVKAIVQIIIRGFIEIIAIAFATMLAASVVFAWLAPLIAILPLILRINAMIRVLNKFKRVLPYGIGACIIYGYYLLPFFKSNLLINNLFAIGIAASIVFALGGVMLKSFAL